MRSHRKFESDRFCRFDVYWIAKYLNNCCIDFGFPNQLLNLTFFAACLFLTFVLKSDWQILTEVCVRAGNVGTLQFNKNQKTKSLKQVEINV